jgi:hypothetical protein
MARDHAKAKRCHAYDDGYPLSGCSISEAENVWGKDQNNADEIVDDAVDASRDHGGYSGCQVPTEKGAAGFPQVTVVVPTDALPNCRFFTSPERLPSRTGGGIPPAMLAFEVCCRDRRLIASVSAIGDRQLLYAASLEADGPKATPFPTAFSQLDYFRFTTF